MKSSCHISFFYQTQCNATPKSLICCQCETLDIYLFIVHLLNITVQQLIHFNPIMPLRAPLSTPSSAPGCLRPFLLPPPHPTSAFQALSLSHPIKHQLQPLFKDVQRNTLTFYVITNCILSSKLNTNSKPLFYCQLTMKAPKLLLH